MPLPPGGSLLSGGLGTGLLVTGGLGSGSSVPAAGPVAALAPPLFRARRRGAGSGGALVPLPPNLVAAVRERLLATPGLQGVLDNVYHRVTPTKPVPPFLVISAVGETFENNNGGADYASWAELQFCLVSEESADADVDGEALRDVCWRALTPTPSHPRLVFSGGGEGGRVPGRKWEVKQPGTGPNGNPLWGFYFSYLFYVTRLLQ